MRRSQGAVCGVFVLSALCCALCGAQQPVERAPIRRQLPQPPAGVKLQPVQGAEPNLAPAPSFHLADSPSARLRSADGTIQQVAVESTLLPLASPAPASNVDIVDENGLVTLVATGAELSSVLRLIADTHGLNLVVGPDVTGPVTVSIRGARLEEVLDAILGVAGFAWNRVDNLLYVTGASATGMDPRVQGRTLQVYQLDYVAASDVEGVANGLMSPVGNAYISESDPADQLRTREVLVVEDTLAAHQRIAQYIAQIDTPPRQVLIEAHVLQVSLTDEERHGIDWRGLANHDGTKITLEGSGFAETPSGNPALSLQIDGRDMDTFIELIREQSNSRTLASPKISVVNHQEAKIQIGQRLPYSVATTTQTTTVQSVEFLEVGIVLTVQPVITADGNVLMTVLPKVSGGKITPSGFPEEDTTEVQTTILMKDGGGVIIGGLIREESIQGRAIVPYIGRIPILGRLFRRSSDEMRRNEVIVALVTHVLPDSCGPRAHEVMELDQTLPDYSKFELLQNQLPVVEYE
jgi:type IV pilus assembly protein PilQ